MGNTILINTDSLQLHNSHGDCIGQCLVMERMSLTEISNVIEVKIVPNPSSDIFEVQIEHSPEGESVLEIQLFNSLGTQVFIPFQLSKRTNNSYIYVFDGNIPSGIYIVKIKGNSFNKVIKLLKL